MLLGAFLTMFSTQEFVTNYCQAGLVHFQLVFETEVSLEIWVCDPAYP